MIMYQECIYSFVEDGDLEHLDVSYYPPVIEHGWECPLPHEVSLGRSSIWSIATIDYQRVYIQ